MSPRRVDGQSFNATSANVGGRFCFSERIHWWPLLGRSRAIITVAESKRIQFRQTMIDATNSSAVSPISLSARHCANRWPKTTIMVKIKQNLSCNSVGERWLQLALYIFVTGWIFLCEFNLYLYAAGSVVSSNHMDTCSTTSLGLNIRDLPSSSCNSPVAHAVYIFL